MKLSRRGKSARRGRHTKRTGKKLRYKGKKVSGSKRYNRGHKRTYKRGRRFQRGGGGEPLKCKFTEPTEDSKGFYELTISERDLFFKKRGVLIQGSPSQKFTITLKVSNIKGLFQQNQDIRTGYATSLFEVTFTRNNKNSKGQTIEHRITDLDYFTDKIKQQNTIAMLNSDGYYYYEYYNFSDALNDAFFKEIQACIITKLIEELTNFKALLDGCKIRIFSLSIKDAKEYGLEKVCNCLKSNQTECRTLARSFGEDNIFLSFFDCIYVNDSGIDKDKTKQHISFIPFHRLVMFTSVNSRGIKSDSNTLMVELRTHLKNMMKQIIERIDALSEALTKAKESNKYDTASNIIKQLGELVNNSVYRQFRLNYTNGSSILSISSCDKIDPELAKFVIEKSNADKSKYCDYDKSVEDPPPDLIPAAAAP